MCLLIFYYNFKKIIIIKKNYEEKIKFILIKKWIKNFTC